MSPRKDGFRLYGLAKKVEGLSRAEKATLVAVCDAQGQIDGYCTASVTTLARDHGHAERKIQYGLHGRTDGDESYPGLVARGLVRAEGPTGGGIVYRDGKKRGQPTKWVVDAGAMLPFLPDKYRARLEAILYPDRPPKGVRNSDSKGARDSERGCTNIHSKGAQTSILRVPLCTQPPEGFPNNAGEQPENEPALPTESYGLPAPADPGDIADPLDRESAGDRSPAYAANKPASFHAGAQRTLPSRPTQPTKSEGGMDGYDSFVKESASVDEAPTPEDATLDAEVDDVIRATEHRQVERANRKQHAIDKSASWRTLPEKLKAHIKTFAEKKCGLEWEDYREETEDEMKAFPTPRESHLLLCAQRCDAIGEERVFQAWKMFVQRQEGFGGLRINPWGLFLRENGDDECAKYDRLAYRGDEPAPPSKGPGEHSQIPPIEAFVAALNGEPGDDDHWVAQCPFPQNHRHGDSNPSLVITQKEDGTVLVHCRGGCDQRDVWQACLAKAKTIDIASLLPLEVKAPKPKAEFTTTDADVAKSHNMLVKNQVPEVREWLREWGISDDVIAKLRLGAYGKVPFTVKKDGVERHFTNPAVWLPHYDHSGKLVAIKGRAMSEKAFTHIPGSSINGLFAAAHLDPCADEVLVLEGDKDVCIAMSAGFNATGILSAGSKLLHEDIELLAHYKQIYLIGDQDKAGIAAMDRLASRLPAEQVIRVHLPTKDTGELFRRHPSDFKDRLRVLLDVCAREHAGAAE
jgi:hypothetical protein